MTMKKVLSSIILLSSVVVSASMLVVTSASADSHVQDITAGQNNPRTVAEIAKLQDETLVSLTGMLVKQTANDREEYEFRDATGSIIVEIDDDLLNPQQFKPNMKVKLVGEVDTHRHRATDIDVLQLEILP